MWRPMIILWSLIRTPKNWFGSMFFLFQGGIFRLHVKLWGCIWDDLSALSRLAIRLWRHRMPCRLVPVEGSWWVGGFWWKTLTPACPKCGTSIYAGIQEKYIVGINIWEISTRKLDFCSLPKVESGGVWMNDPLIRQRPGMINPQNW